MLANGFGARKRKRRQDDEDGSGSEDSSDDDDVEGTLEERAFRYWINTLDLKDMDGNDIFINNLYDDLQDGIVLCKAIHKINDSVVEWNRIEKVPNNTFKKGINC